MYKKMVFIGLVAIGVVSCKNSATTETNAEVDSVATTKAEVKSTIPDIAGYYRLPETGCDLALTITKEKDRYRYFFKGEHLDIEGVALVSMEDSTCYVTFDGPIGNAPPKTVSGQFSDNGITIQNSGNADNQYQYFECDEKYLEFKKN